MEQKSCSAGRREMGNGKWEMRIGMGMGIEREFGNLEIGKGKGRGKRESLGKFIIQFEWESATVPT